MTSSAERNAAKIQHRDTKLSHLEETSTASLPQFDLDAGLNIILRSASELMDAALSLVAVRKYESEPLRPVAVNQTMTSLSRADLETLSQSLPAGWSLHRQQVVYLSQSQLESDLYILPGLTGVIYAPVIARGKAVGVLCLANVQPNRHWPEEALELAGRLASHVGLLIEMSRTYDDLRRCLSGDPRETHALQSLLATWQAMHTAHTQLIEDVWQRQHQCQAAESRFRSLVETAQDAVVILQDRRFRYVNHRLQEILGYSPDECYQMENPLDLVVEEHRPRVAENQRRKLHGEQMPLYEFVVRDNKGSEVVLEATSSMVEYEGRPAILEIWRDVTRQRQLRAQLLLSEKMAAMGQLISGVAHELNNPLTAVLGFSELVLMNGQLSDELRRDLTTIVSEAQRARKIVQNLLAFAHTQESEKQLGDLNQVLNDTLVLKEYELRVNQVQVIKQLDPQLPRVIADVDQLKQVFLNIIVNAEQAMVAAQPPRRLEIKTGVKTCYIAGSASDWVEIKFRDTGPGIPPEHLPHIFDLFFTTKELGQGTGLGLAISYNIIKDHGGRIYAQNAPDGGVEFIIELPVQTRQAFGL
jgi:PAS domain S-box-containing protein